MIFQDLTQYKHPKMTESEYFVTDLDAGDQITAIEAWDGVKQ